jgi:hypothetical protein
MRMAKPKKPKKVRKSSTGRFAVVALLCTGTAVIAANWRANSVAPEPSPARAVSLRFTTDREVQPAHVVAVQPVHDRTVEVMSALMFNSNPITRPASHAAQAEHPATIAYAKADVAERTASVPPRRPAPARTTREPPTLFNDAQIASIKARLKLSSYQEQHWPAVESALREIAWHHARDHRHGKSASTLDEAEVQKLKYAAFPFVMSLREDQKRELRMLAQIMGLEKIAAQF